jgi:hypothetical protein
VTLSRSIRGWPNGSLQMDAEIGEDGGLASALEPGAYRLAFVENGPRVTLSTRLLGWTESGPALSVLRLGKPR